ncbi:MAG: hypothetical protein IT376_01195 [Polyangiaceae bacterium]|nr:hypothetical protein [Polyangiaceae bacterium]
MERKRPHALARHLEGWQAGALAVGIAALAALLAVPRPVAPDGPPLPLPDRPALARLSARERARAEGARAAPLPFEVRAAGEALRRLGAGAARDGVDPIDVRDLRRAVEGARAAHGDAPLLALRALQTELFLAALTRYEEQGVSEPDLDELGGDLLPMARASGWVRPDRRLRLDPTERAVLFRIRWAELAGVRGDPAFAPTVDEWRVHYSVLLRYPERGAALEARDRAALRLRYVTALASRDPDYPVLLARGALLLELGRPAAAADALRTFLAEHDSGPWRLHAANHLAYAVQRLPPEEL